MSELVAADAAEGVMLSPGSMNELREKLRRGSVNEKVIERARRAFENGGQPQLRQRLERSGGLTFDADESSLVDYLEANRP